MLNEALIQTHLSQHRRLQYLLHQQAEKAQTSLHMHMRSLARAFVSRIHQVWKAQNKIKTSRPTGYVGLGIKAGSCTVNAVSCYILCLQNTPNDLQLLSDAPAHHIFVLIGPVDPHQSSLPEVLCVLMLHSMFTEHPQ